MPEIVCAKCRVPFSSDQEDENFYARMNVPLPTWCPRCRLSRRLVHYPNVLRKKYYKRACSATGQEIVSIFPQSAIFPVYNHDYWFSDAWDAMEYGLSFDESVPFLAQVHALRRRVPRYNATVVSSPGCDYCLAIRNSKDCVLSTGWKNQNAYYVNGSGNQDCLDSWYLIDSDHVIECSDSERSHNLLLSEFCHECVDGAFLSDCRNTSNSFGSVGLRNKKHCFFNTQYSAPEYREKRAEYDLGSYRGLEAARDRFLAHTKRYPRRFARIMNSQNVTGDYIRNSKNCHECFDIYGVEDSKFTALAGANLSWSYDCFDAGTFASLLYESVAVGIHSQNIRFSSWVEESKDITYSDLCHNSANLFGCVGLRNKKYCILNRQYSKEEYEAFVPRIIAQMNELPYKDKQGLVYRFGEFHPPELSIFAYNDTSAEDYFPLSETEAKAQGLMWSDTLESSLAPTITVGSLPDHVSDAPDSLSEAIIECAHKHECEDDCPGVFRILPWELTLYKKQNLALPRLCPACRHAARLRGRGSFETQKRSCGCGQEPQENKDDRYINQTNHWHGDKACSNMFITAHSPEDASLIYCGECYDQEFSG